MLNVYQPKVVPGWEAVVAGPPAVAVAVALFRHHYIYYGRRTSSSLYGTPGGNTQGCESKIEAARRVTLEDTGMDLGNVYLPYQGVRDLSTRGGVMPVHLYLGILDIDCEPGEGIADAVLGGPRDDNHGIICDNLDGFPRCQPKGRHQAWAFIQAEEANAQPQKYSQVIRWALEVYCRKAPEVPLPWDHEAIPLSQAAHVQGLIDHE